MTENAEISKLLNNQEYSEIEQASIDIFKRITNESDLREEMYELKEELNNSNKNITKVKRATDSTKMLLPKITNELSDLKERINEGVVLRPELKEELKLISENINKLQISFKSDLKLLEDNSTENYKNQRTYMNKVTIEINELKKSSLENKDKFSTSFQDQLSNSMKMKNELTDRINDIEISISKCDESTKNHFQRIFEIYQKEQENAMNRIRGITKDLIFIKNEHYELKEQIGKVNDLMTENQRHLEKKIQVYEENYMKSGKKKFIYLNSFLALNIVLTVIIIILQFI